MMKNENLRHRTKKFALLVIQFVEALPQNKTCHILGRQLLRSGTSVGANYRAACRAKSPADFISKMGTLEEEADESAFWTELLLESNQAVGPTAAALLKEADELTAIAVASIKTAKRSQSSRKPKSASPVLNPKTNSALRTPHSAVE
jgi:four helix bundle protein